MQRKPCFHSMKNISEQVTPEFAARAEKFQEKLEPIDGDIIINYASNTYRVFPSKVIQQIYPSSARQKLLTSRLHRSLTTELYIPREVTRKYENVRETFSEIIEDAKIIQTEFCIEVGRWFPGLIVFAFDINHCEVTNEFQKKIPDEWQYVEMYFDCGQICGINVVFDDNPEKDLGFFYNDEKNLQLNAFLPVHVLCKYLAGGLYEYVIEAYRQCTASRITIVVQFDNDIVVDNNYIRFSDKWFASEEWGWEPIEYDDTNSTEKNSTLCDVSSNDAIVRSRTIVFTGTNVLAQAQMKICESLKMQKVITSYTMYPADKTVSWKNCIGLDLTVQWHHYAHRRWTYQWTCIIEFCLVTNSTLLPPYVLLEIIDWLPKMWRWSHMHKITQLIALHKSMRKIVLIRPDKKLKIVN